MTRDRESNAPMPFIIGAPRSGTTLLRLMLDAHPDIAIPPETGFLVVAHQLHGSKDRTPDELFQAITSFPLDAPAWRDFGIGANDFKTQLRTLEPFSIADGFRLFYRMYSQRFGKSRWGDKTPMYAGHMQHIQQVLPEARFVHLVRDGRDVAVSLRRQWFSPGQDIDTLAQFWRDVVLDARRQAMACTHYLEIRYEDLVTRSERSLRRICNFIEADYHPDMQHHHLRAAARLDEHGTRIRQDGTVLVTFEQRSMQQALTRMPVDSSQIGTWRHHLSASEIRRFELLAGDLLSECGYPLQDESSAPFEPNRG